jgi:mono/diheme cytochrome c family protein
MLTRYEPVIRLLVALLPLGLLGDGASLRAEDPTPATISAESRALFEKQIQPLLVRTCGDCHGKEPTDNDLDLTSFGSAQAILAKPKVLGDVAERLRLGDMPPKDAPQPTEAEREQLLDWINAALDAEAAARAGDPGPVTLRRLSNTEYDNAIRDLTSVDMRPTQAREFPVDSVGGEGFANVGDAMPVTPELVERYHQTARDVAARAVLLPSGFRFSPSTERPDWTEEALKPLRSFHARYAGPNGEPPLAAHLAATLKHRDRLTRDGAAAIAAVAAEEKLNATYLAALWNGLNGKPALLPLTPPASCLTSPSFRRSLLKPIIVLLMAFLLAPLSVLEAAPPDLSRITSRADLDAVIAATPDPALKQALADHAEAILAAAARHRHVEAVIHTIEKSPGKFTKINTTPEALKKLAGGDIPLFDTLTLVSTAILSARGHQHRTTDTDPYDGGFVEHLGHIKSLENVSLILTSLEGAWLTPLFQLENLHTLLIEKAGGPANLGDDVLARLGQLSRLPKLKSLSLHGFKASDAGLEHLAGIKTLEYLSFHASVPGHAFAKFDGWTNLKSIRFHGNTIDDEGLAAICERFPHLESLNLIHATALTNASGPHLRKLHKLKSLYITDGPKMTAAWLLNVRGLPLELLLVNKGPATPPTDAIATVQAIPSLRRLSIDGTLFTDADLESLAAATQLESLSISGLTLSDARLAILQRFSHLKKLEVPQAGVAPYPDAEAKLKAVLPKVEVKVSR